jgi:hypothetical protein
MMIQSRSSLPAHQLRRLLILAREVPEDWRSVLYAMGPDLPVAEWAARTGLRDEAIHAVLRLRAVHG